MTLAKLRVITTKENDQVKNVTPSSETMPSAW
jgi:hypothetical protein